MQVHSALAPSCCANKTPTHAAARWRFGVLEHPRKLHHEKFTQLVIYTNNYSDTIRDNTYIYNPQAFSPQVMHLLHNTIDWQRPRKKILATVPNLY